MNTKDTRNYMQQMKRRNVLQKNNKEKQMQEEIMCLKEENRMLIKQNTLLQESNKKLQEENDRMSDLYRNRE